MTGPSGRVPMPVRAVDDKSSDTLVVVSGEGFWTGSSTLPHLHHFFALLTSRSCRPHGCVASARSLDDVRTASRCAARIRPSVVRGQLPERRSDRPANATGVLGRRLGREARELGPTSPGLRGSPRTPRSRNAGRRAVAASAPWTPEPHPDRTLDFAVLDDLAVDHRTARPLHEGANQDEGDGDRDDQRDHAKGQAVLTLRTEHALPIDERTADDATGVGRVAARDTRRNSIAR